MSTTREDLLRKLEAENRSSNAEGMFFLQAVAERSGMNLTDLQCLTILTSTGPITAGQLTEMMGLTTGAITGVVNRMERAGYVRREKDPADARRVIVHPTMEALERAGAGFFGSQERVMDELLSGYDDRDLAVFLEIMRKSNAKTRAETARIRTSSEGNGGGEFSAPLGSVESGRLVFANGISRLTLRAASVPDTLYQARFDGPAPKVAMEDGTVTFRYSQRFRGLFDRRSRSGEMALSEVVPWEIDVRGGAYRMEVDLGSLKLTSFAIKGGMSDCTLTLPEPSGMVPVRVSGGVSKLRVHRPADAEARLTIKGGFSALTFDDQALNAMGVKEQFQSPGYDGASKRYEIVISGGASEIVIQQAS